MGWIGFFGKGTAANSDSGWKELTDASQLDGIVMDSATRPQLIFKHSTRCNISTMAKDRLERSATLTQHLDVWYLDLLQFRPLSDLIAERMQVMHESPQAILIMNGEVRHVSAHSAITADSVMDAL